MDVRALPYFKLGLMDTYPLYLDKRFTLVINKYRARVCGYPEGTKFYFKYFDRIIYNGKRGYGFSLLASSPWTLIEINAPCTILFH